VTSVFERLFMYIDIPLHKTKLLSFQRLVFSWVKIVFWILMTFLHLVVCHDLPQLVLTEFNNI
jgi:hypothetical protein